MDYALPLNNSFLPMPSDQHNLLFEAVNRRQKSVTQNRAGVMLCQGLYAGFPASELCTEPRSIGTFSFDYGVQMDQCLDLEFGPHL